MFVKQIKNFATEVAAAVAARLLPAGGTINQVLSKTAATDYAVAWTTPSAGGAAGNMNKNFASGSGGTSILNTETTIGSVTITPQSADSTIMVVARLVALKDSGNTNRRTVTAYVKRNTTKIGVECVITSQNLSAVLYGPAIISAIDSTHNTTSPITYTLYATCSTTATSTADNWEILVVELMGAVGAAGTNGTNGANGTNADMTRSSTSSVAIGTGSKTFAYTSSTNLGWGIGTRLRISNTASIWMEGAVTAVSSTSVTISCDLLSGSGTYSSWSISIAGEKGIMRETKQTLTDATTVSWNLSTSRNAQLTLGGNRTLAITNAADGDYGTLLVIQDATGNRTLTLPAGSRVINAGATTAITLSTPPNARDILTFYFDGTNYYWNIGKNY